jgi:type II secretory pathway pseudopilin PulG
VKKIRAFSLLEIIVVAALTAMLLSFTLMSLRRPINKAGPQVVADQVAEFLRRTRNKAMKEHEPLAVVFSSNGGASSTCQSVAERAGEANPRIVRVKDFATENPQTVIFIGSYGASGTWSITPPDSGGSNYFTQDILGYPGSARLIEWVGADAPEPMLIFLPDGTVASNDLPHLGGSYRVVVSQGAETTGASVSGAGVLPSGPKLFEVKKVSHPYTVSIASTGLVKVSPGIADGDGSVAEVEAALPLANPAPRMALAPPTEMDPNITEFKAEPNAGFLEGLFGVEQIMHPSRQLTFRVTATQANDEELYCEFEEDSGLGQFSSPGAKKMRYQPAVPPFYTASWRSAWQWSPPPNAKAGDLYSVSATVTAERGGSDTTKGNASYEMDIVLYNAGKIFFGGKNAVTGRSEVYSVRADGTDLQRVTVLEGGDTQQAAPAASRDGRKLIYQSFDVSDFTAALYVQNRRGGLTSKLTDKGIFPSLSDDSTVAVFQQFLGFGTIPNLFTCNPDSGLWPPPVNEVFDPDPGLPINISTVGLRSPAVSPPIAFGPGGTPPDFAADPKNRRVRLPRRIAFEANLGMSDPGHVAIYTADFHDPGRSIEPHNVIRQTQGGPMGGLGNPGGDLRPVWHPDGTKIAFYSDRNGKRQIWAIPFNDDVSAEVSETSDGAVCLTPGFINARDPYYGPNGANLVFTSDDDASGKEWDLYIQQLDPATGYLTPKGAPLQMGLGRYAVFTELFEDINRPVWTL